MKKEKLKTDNVRKSNNLKLIIWNSILLVITPVIAFLAEQMITLFSAINHVYGLRTISDLINRLCRMQPKYLLYNLLICYVIFGISVIIFRKVRSATVFYMLFMVILALINYYVVAFRGQAFILLDLLGMRTAAEVAGNYTFSIPWFILLILAVTAAFVILQFKFQKLELGQRGIRNTIGRLCVLAVVAMVLYKSYPAVQKLENVYLWNLNEDHADKGYVYTLLREIKYFSVEKPENYSAESLDEITEKYSNKNQKNENKVQATNIIMIMNESLADFEDFGELKANEEILPFIRSMNKNVKRGKLQMPTFGGGTSRSEYEVLTGNCLQFLPSGSVPYQLYVRSPEYGMADILKAQGYETIAMHPNRADSWNRENVYECMGFDQFLNVSNWGGKMEKIRNFCSDQSLYNKITELYEQKEAGQKRFTFCVTIQNHGGYNESNNNGYEPSVKLNYDTEYPLAETYLSLAKESDKAFQNLIEYFEKVEEPTMIVMFGDHWPQIETGFQSEAAGKDIGNMGLEERQKLYQTPYVIWTNYESETVEEDISSNYLGSYVMKLAGVELPEYNQFLVQLKEKLPIIGMGTVCDSAGKWYETQKLPDEYQKLLSEYQELIYNAQFEKKDIRENLFRVQEQS